MPRELSRQCRRRGATTDPKNGSVKMKPAVHVALTLFALSVCVGDVNTDVSGASGESRACSSSSGGTTWPLPCDAPLSAQWLCPSTRRDSAVRTMVVLLNSFEKLTWATVGLGRLLIMTNFSADVSLVEPCIADSGKSCRCLKILSWYYMHKLPEASPSIEGTSKAHSVHPLIALYPTRDWRFRASRLAAA